MAINKRDTIKIFTPDDYRNRDKIGTIPTETKKNMLMALEVSKSEKNQQIEQIRKRMYILTLAEETIPKILDIIDSKGQGSVNVNDIFDQDVLDHYAVLNVCKEVLSSYTDWTLFLENNQSLENFQIIKKTDYINNSVIIN